jgi:hypothetical protein
MSQKAERAPDPDSFELLQIKILIRSQIESLTGAEAQTHEKVDIPAEAARGDNNTNIARIFKRG